jgi:glycosyltransferase involved in cell wall biosynthesis
VRAVARICIVRQNLFPLDPSVRREVLALVAAGHDVDVICRRGADERRRERWGAVGVTRLSVPHRRAGLAAYALEYATFFVLASGLLSARHLRRRYDVVEVMSVPDALVFAAAIPRLLGARILLDLRECMPELFATRFKRAATHPLIRVLALLERASLRFAHLAVTPTEGLRDVFVGRGAPADKVAVVIDGADEMVFDPTMTPPRPRERGRFVLLSHGTVEESFGLDLAVRAVAALRDEIPGLRLEILGEGSQVENLRALAADLGVADRVHLSGGWIPLSDLAPAVARADAGIVTVRRDLYRELTLPNKLFEFVAMRRPVIASRTRAVLSHFGEDSLQLFESGDVDDLIRAIRELHDDPALGERLAARAAEVGEPYRWTHQSRRYLSVVEQLLPHHDEQLGVGEAQDPEGEHPDGSVEHAPRQPSDT